ncbi:MAG TPA: hypothetical protein VG011_03355, partial [Steroidobacteraceae bacterium]|nr:hypothetical protein [Steroidobacteraceae bacterium]
ASINSPSTIAANIQMIANGERVSGAASEEGGGVNLWDCSFTVLIGLSARLEAHPDHSSGQARCCQVERTPQGKAYSRRQPPSGCTIQNLDRVHRSRTGIASLLLVRSRGGGMLQ